MARRPGLHRFAGATLAVALAAAGCGRAGHPAPAVPGGSPSSPLPVTLVSAADMQPPAGYVPGLRFTDATFPTASAGWVGGLVSPACPGAGDAAAASAGVVETSSDGGRAWSVRYRGADAVLALAATGAMHAWALAVPARDVSACAQPPAPGEPAAQVLLGTADGGRSWDVLGPAPGIDALVFTDPEDGVAGREGCSGRPPACSGALLRTADGGRTWRAVPAADPAPAGGSPPPVVAVTSGGGALWALEVGAGAAPRVMRSDDGGASWREAGTLPPQAAAAGAEGALAFTSPELGWAAVFAPASCTMAHCALNAVYRTADGGRSWSPVAAGAAPCDAARSVLAASSSTVLVARGVNLAACPGPATTILASADGGASWTSVSWSLLSPLHLRAVAGSPRTFCAVASAAVLCSTDGGARWIQVLPAPVPVAGIDFLSPAVGWGIGTVSDPGALLATTDGGRTWAVVRSFADVRLSGLAFAGLADGWVLGAVPAWNAAAGRLWRTQDGGRTWQALPAGAQALPPAAALGFPAPRDGLVVPLGADASCPSGPCGGGRLLDTADGGASWHAAGAVPDPRDLAAADVTARGDVWGLWTSAGQGTCGPVLRRLHGAAWSALGCLSGPALTGRPALQFVSPAQGFAMLLQVLTPAVPGRAAAVRPILLDTDDAGLAWTARPLPLASRPSSDHAMFFLNRRQGWLLGGGAVWMTDDGGLSWVGQGA